MGVFDKFIKFLDDNNFNYEIGPEDESAQRVIMRQTIKNAGTAAIVCAFDRDNFVANVYIWNIAKIESPLKRDELLRLVNNFNREYEYYTYCVTPEGDIYIKIPIIDAKGLDFDLLFTLLQVVFSQLEKEAIGKIMKLQWS